MKIQTFLEKMNEEVEHCKIEICSDGYVCISIYANRYDYKYRRETVCYQVTPPCMDNGVLNQTVQQLMKKCLNDWVK